MTLWGGRFDGEVGDVTWEFTVDQSDSRIVVEDIEVSLAHAQMLGETGIIPEEDAAELVRGLGLILGEAMEGQFEYRSDDEDIHTAVERRLGELIGPVAGKLHTGRSRNDQVATGMRLYMKGAGLAALDLMAQLLTTLVGLARTHASTVIPSYTHLQQAQSTTLGSHLLAHTWALTRDFERFGDFLARADFSPLGAGASAGSGLDVDSEMTARLLDFQRPVPNPLDAVGSRDTVAEFVFCCAQTMVNLSRLAEEIILWSTREFGWITLSDQVSTGSSALPHKRNPDIAELIRGRTAAVTGDVAAILGLQKGLPLTYNRDFQEDKRIVFHADDTLYGSLEAMDALLQGITFHPPMPSSEVATLDLADALVTRGVPFREAHEVVGRVVRELETRGGSIEDVTDADLIAVDERFVEGDAGLVDPVASANRRGVTESVMREIAAIETWLAGDS